MINYVHLYKKHIFHTWLFRECEEITFTCSSIRGYYAWNTDYVVFNECTCPTDIKDILLVRHACTVYTILNRV